MNTTKLPTQAHNNLANKHLGAHCLGVILAGGMSSRMGQNKAQLKHFAQEQQTMLNFSEQVLKKTGINNIVVSGAFSEKNHYGQDLNNNNRVNHQANQQVNDTYQQLGPLAGIYSVWQQYQPQAILALPVDLPLISEKELQQLILAGELSGKASFFSEHYLPLYLPMNALTVMLLNKTFSELDQHKPRGPAMHKFIASLAHNSITLKNANALFNCNTPAQWQQAKNLYRLQRT